ncbi:cyclic nucleotide-binding domain-containing protein [Aureimonas sp. Leaf324]|uniref:cyclic nucleotide-binding domain-containing protein n=1 Tax=Aureimonas sp. Leaf324 TaxID=1736336 RepID=UPI001FCDF228|nr:cyclic nucleotide-binding domain-containing protein [Aureimonas sp. Leaf324]
MSEAGAPRPAGGVKGVSVGMSLESDMELLGGVSLFQDLTRDQLRLLAFGAEHRHLRSGEILFRAEARADAGFIVASGTVNLVDGEGDARRVVETAGPGSLLGEMALMADTRRPATAVTATDCDFIRISRPLFRRMLQEYPEIAAMLHARIAGELEAMTARILALSDVFDYDDETDAPDAPPAGDGEPRA